MKSFAFLAVLVVFLTIYVENSEADGYGHGHGHGHSAKGTACIVKGSYCNCHYCKCEKGHVHCGGYGHGGHGKIDEIQLRSFFRNHTLRNIQGAGPHRVALLSVSILL